MRLFISLMVAALAGPAAAHPGHLADLAGHDHWVAGAAIGVAIALGLWGALKGKGADKDDAEEADAADADAEEAAA
jgi:hypothetical protein